MGIEEVTKIVSDALWIVIKTSVPILLVSLVIGLLVSIFQTVTSIQEQTLTFVPKLLCVFGVMILLGHWMLNNMVTFMQELWADFSIFIR